MKKLFYSAESLQKIKEIEAYLSDTYGIEAVKKFRTNLKSRLKSLLKFPRQGASLRDLYGFDTEFRQLYVPPHYVFYIIREDNVEVINIYHGKEDYLTKLFS